MRRTTLERLPETEAIERLTNTDTLYLPCLTEEQQLVRELFLALTHRYALRGYVIPKSMRSVLRALAETFRRADAVSCSLTLTASIAAIQRDLAVAADPGVCQAIAHATRVLYSV